MRLGEVERERVKVLVIELDKSEVRDLQIETFGVYQERGI